MKREGQTYLIIVCAILGLLFFEFRFRQFHDTVQTEIKQLPEINKILVRVPCNIFIQQGEEQKLVIEGNASQLKKSATFIKDGELQIGQDNLLAMFDLLNLFSSETPINIYVTVKDVEKLVVCDNCKIMASGDVSQKRLNLNIEKPGAMIFINSHRT
ncbi:MAG: GIN domain-containing protein [Candidatus Cyclobacteriaceae bacterium M3_2C_046]